MSFLNQIANKFSAGRKDLADRVLKFKNREFMEGTVAVCACISMASEGVGSDEKQKMIGFMQNSPELSVFDTSEIIAVFNKLIANYEFDADIGKGEAMKLITRMSNKKEEAQLMLRVAIAIGKSDGNFDPEEKACARQICQALDLTPSDYDL